MMPVEFEPEAECPVVRGEPGVLRAGRAGAQYLQRLFGYCLTNAIGEQSSW